ncbi:MAG: hypothetical protein KQJ78_01225 [Deltaproteobacteria bacterium]|nr:hypothetical protein [Deltaproteobacteria bacterium]
MRELAKNELGELLHKNWMTHDGMWFLHCLAECGIEKTNRVNRAAIRSMAAFEIPRCLEALGLEPPRSLDEVADVINGIFSVLKADFMDFSCEFLEKDKLVFHMGRCFAHEGVKRMGVLEQYECGIYERMEAWFRGLGLEFQAEPRITNCLKLEGQDCRRVYRLALAS